MISSYKEVGFLGFILQKGGLFGVRPEMLGLFLGGLRLLKKAQAACIPPTALSSQDPCRRLGAPERHCLGFPKSRA